MATKKPEIKVWTIYDERTGQWGWVGYTHEVYHRPCRKYKYAKGAMRAARRWCKSVGLKCEVDTR